MNQFDALLAQISDLESVNRESERKYLALNQRYEGCEMEFRKVKNLLMISEEKEAVLRDQLSSLKLEKETEHKLYQRLKAQHAQLKCTTTDQLRAIEEEKKQMIFNRQKYANGLEINNKKIREVVNDFKRMMSQHELCGHDTKPNLDLSDPKPALEKMMSPNDDQKVDPDKLIGESQSNEQLAVSLNTVEASKVEDCSGVEALEQMVNVHPKADVATITCKLENELQQALEEYQALDDYTKQIQAQLEEMQHWHTLVETIGKDLKCEQCGHKLELNARIERLSEQVADNREEK